MACLFCDVVSRSEPAEVVLDEPAVVGFLDNRPVFRGHTLLVPRVHVDTLLELPDELTVPLFSAARRTAAAMTSALGAQGTFVAMNNVVSQSVPHLHVHVVPRTKGDGLRGFFWPRTKYEEGEAAAYGERLRQVLVA
ncbi:HIT family protein [Aeromicrobium sp. Leaf245]|uniref:HIT family protein n=1 Tax=Aeromicrobium sp. Leaf245 TaxID=1736306 RepID=UPI0006F6B925|nr:HIT family protein [Aeromicrobium sp. Leaf245]KQO41852.1 HIT family hydrolase [Aeromicrobium sp. Leaf245]